MGEIPWKEMPSPAFSKICSVASVFVVSPYCAARPYLAQAILSLASTVFTLVDWKMQCEFQFF